MKKPKKPAKKPDLEAAVRHLVKVNQGLIKAQRVNTEKLNTLLALAEDWQQERHLDHDPYAGMPQFLDDEPEEEWAP